MQRMAIGAIAAALAACAPRAVSQPAPAPVPTVVNPAPPPQPAPNANPQPARVIVVRVMTTNAGMSGVFSPATVRARRGDVVRFEMVDGAAPHNVSFRYATKPNPEGVPLPDDSPYFFEAGQFWDLKIELPPGTYHFACVPHAAMGQVGMLEVSP
jgi:plastocyanin